MSSQQPHTNTHTLYMIVHVRIQSFAVWHVHVQIECECGPLLKHLARDELGKVVFPVTHSLPPEAVLLVHHLQNFPLFEWKTGVLKGRERDVKGRRREEKERREGIGEERREKHEGKGERGGGQRDMHIPVRG